MYSVAQTAVVDAYRVPYTCVRSSGSSCSSSSRATLKIRFRVQPHNSLQFFRDTRKFQSVRPRAQVPGDVSLVTEESFRIGAVPEDEVEDEQVLALGYGWKVREASRFDIEELRAVAQVQASSFHLQTAVFDDLFFKIFKVSCWFPDCWSFCAFLFIFIFLITRKLILRSLESGRNIGCPSVQS